MSRILVVDDDPGTRETFSAILRGAGFDVLLAANGMEGLASADRRGADVVLLDLCLPDLNGIEVLRSLRARGNSVPVVVMTAFGSIRSAVEATKLGAIEYREKPLADDELMAIVESALHSTRPSGYADDMRPVPFSHAVERWATLVVRVITAREDPRSVTDWSNHVAVPAGTVRIRCEAVGVSAKASLDFARTLRAVCGAHRNGCRPETLLDMDPRTMKRIFSHSYEPGWTGTCPSVSQFLAEQPLVRDAALLGAIEACLRDITRTQKM